MTNATGFDLAQYCRTSLTRDRSGHEGVTRVDMLRELHHVLRVSARVQVAPGMLSGERPYGSAWTSRASTELLIAEANEMGRNLELSQVTPDFWDWSDSVLAAYHYFAVDRRDQPTLFASPTFFPDFTGAAARGQLDIRVDVTQAGRNIGRDHSASRVRTLIDQQRSSSGMLCLSGADDVAVMIEALRCRAARARPHRSRRQPVE